MLGRPSGRRNGIGASPLEARQARWGAAAPYRGRHAMGGLVVGLIITIIGVLFLLQNLGIRFFDNVWDFWPVILIVLGVSRASTAYGWGGRVWGGILIVVGGIFLLENLFNLPFLRWSNLWPLILMVVGVGMLARNLERQHNARNSAATAGSCPTVGTRVRGVTSASTLNEWAVFSGVPAQSRIAGIRGRRGDRGIRGVEIDLRNAGMKNEEAIVDVNAVFGGVEIRAPETWEIVMSGTPIFGGYEDETAPARGTDGEKRPRLIIAGSAFSAASP
jgi:predicted membrane protein